MTTFRTLNQNVSHCSKGHENSICVESRDAHGSWCKVCGGSLHSYQREGCSLCNELVASAKRMALRNAV